MLVGRCYPCLENGSDPLSHSSLALFEHRLIPQTSSAPLLQALSLASLPLQCQLNRHFPFLSCKRAEQTGRVRHIDPVRIARDAVGSAVHRSLREGRVVVDRPDRVGDRERLGRVRRPTTETPLSTVSAEPRLHQDSIMASG